MTTPTRKPGRRAGTRPASATPAAPKATGPSARELELERVLVAVALANGGDLIVTPEHAWAATHRPDIEGVTVRYTVKGLEIQTITVAEEEDDLASGVQMDNPVVDPVAVAADLVDYSDNHNEAAGPAPVYSGYGS